MQNQNILEMKQITKIFPGVKALDQVDFSVQRGEVHCLIGANGAGKSTLMKILSGAYTQDEGEIIFDNKKILSNTTKARKEEGISIIYQELSLFNELTVGENIYINQYPMNNGVINWKQVYDNARQLANALNIQIDVTAKVSSLNIGQRQLTEIMKAIACNSKLIVMDEPSSTLSKNEFQILVRVIQDLKSKGITIIYISHHLDELFLVGDRITVLRDGKFIVCKPVDELNENSLVEYMTGIDISKIQNEEHEIHPISDKVVLELKNVSNHKVSNINLCLHEGEILGLYGLVGSGRTEILHSLFGLSPLQNGEIIMNGKKIHLKNTRQAIRHRIGLAPENRKQQGLVLPLPVWENMSMVSLKKFKQKGKINYQGIHSQCSNYKEQLKIKTPDIHTTTGTLSGGNQQKIILAKWLMEDCDILLLDEPTQGIDVVAKEEIYKLIREMTHQGKSVIVVSSELEELLRLCDNIHVLYDGKQVTQINKADFNTERILQASVVGK